MPTLPNVAATRPLCRKQPDQDEAVAAQQPLRHRHAVHCNAEASSRPVRNAG
jgi:hypothetical protein